MENDREEILRKAVKIGADLFATLGVVDTVNGPALPTVIRVRQASGALLEEPCVLIEVDEPRRYKARVRAREWALDQKLDLDRDKDLVDQLENFELLAYAIREPTKPYSAQVCADGKELFQKYKKGPLGEIWGIFEHWNDLMNPRFGEMNRDELWAVISRIHKEETLRPLMLIAGIEQASCILLSAKAALTSPMAPSSLRLPWTSPSPSDSTSPAAEASTSPNS